MRKHEWSDSTICHVLLTKVKIIGAIITLLAALGALAVFRPSAIQVPALGDDIVIIYAHAYIGQPRPRSQAVHVVVNVDETNYYSKNHYGEDEEISIQVTVERGQIVELFVTQVTILYDIGCWFTKHGSKRLIGTKKLQTTLRVECTYNTNKLIVGGRT